ncbi:ABC transporter substrate-binding protein [Acetobacter orientalis]|uniref:ABC transporter substrate-binding protein n=1 Tax=Acetobacter orientalis TaxID=146474 RepID=A0A2Z5ZDQ1_9PROT|nr:ABC transporter substrate-binding protein [Acetobacter orientalis]
MHDEDIVDKPHVQHGLFRLVNQFLGEITHMRNFTNLFLMCLKRPMIGEKQFD